MTCMVHNRKKGAVVSRKLDLDQMSIAHTPTEKHKCDQTHFLNWCNKNYLYLNVSEMKILEAGKDCKKSRSCCGKATGQF